MRVSAELRAVAAKIKRCRQEGEGWPLLVYEDVLQLADRWDADGRGSGYRSFDAWLRREATGKSWSLARFKLVRDVVGCLGEDIRRTWLWPPAQWAYNAIGDSSLKRIVLDKYPEWMAENHGHPLSITQVQRRVRALRMPKLVENVA